MKVPHTVRRIRSWIDKKIGSAALRGQESLPTAALKYIPYKRGEKVFVIARSATGPSDGMTAIPPRHLWHGYGETAEEYLATGRQHVGAMIDLLGDSDFKIAAGHRILDFGCASGRMIRHLAESAGACEIWGTDINAEHIYWCQRHLSPPFHFATTTTIPHLPFEDRYFDLVYAGSVFTHIDDLADAWLLELGRVLKPAGRLYLTIHDEHTLELLETEWRESALAERVRLHTSVDGVVPDFAMLVIGRDTRSQVFYSMDHFRNKLEPVYEILSVTAEAYGYQTALVAKRR